MTRDRYQNCMACCAFFGLGSTSLKIVGHGSRGPVATPIDTYKLSFHAIFLVAYKNMYSYISRVPGHSLSLKGPTD